MNSTTTTTDRITTYAYPKIPRDYHESVTSETVTAEDVILMEKFDGSNAKIFIYDSRFDDSVYQPAIFEFDDLTHGDVFIGTKTNVKKRLSDPIETSDGALNQLQRYLRSELNVTALLDLHTQYDSPLMLFGENMGVQTTLEYNRLEGDIPVFLGFDVLVMQEYEKPPANPFNERFDAYLAFDEMIDVFESVGLETARTVSKEEVNYSVTGDSEDITVSVDVPTSVYGNVTAEGVVIRNDDRDRRVKFTSEEFEERSNIAWSKLEQDCVTGSELFCARYVTNQRIDKNLCKYVTQNDCSVYDVSPDVLTDVVLADVWEEELHDIIGIQQPIRTGVIRTITWQRCRRVLQKIRTNIELNDTTVTELWKSHRETDAIGLEHTSEGNMSNEIVVFDLSPQQKHCHGSIAGTSESVEDALVRHIVSANRIQRVAEDIAEGESKSFGNWVIPDVNDYLQDRVWYENLWLLATFPGKYTPSKLQYAMMEYVRDVILEYTL